MSILYCIPKPARASNSVGINVIPDIGVPAAGRNTQSEALYLLLPSGYLTWPWKMAHF